MPPASSPFGYDIRHTLMVKTGVSCVSGIPQVTRHKMCRWKGRIRTFRSPSAECEKYPFFQRIRLGFAGIRLGRAIRDGFAGGVSDGDIVGGTGHPPWVTGGGYPGMPYPGMPCPSIPEHHPLPADAGCFPRARSGRGVVRTLPSMSSSTSPASSMRKNRKTPFWDQNQISRERYAGA